MTDLAIVGASGFAGAEMLRLLASHPEFVVTHATAESQAGQRVGELYPHLKAAYPLTELTPFDAAACAEADVVVLGLPHGLSGALVPDLVNAGVDHIVDLASDFRLKDLSLYPEWYGAAHPSPELMERFTYGLPELWRDEVTTAQHLALPGCYPTTVTLALAPIVGAGLIETQGIIVDAVSGVSGAGRPPKPHTTFTSIDGDVSAYGLLTHRHTPEIEQNLSRVADSKVSVLFTPHLVPMTRGIHATCHGRAKRGVTTEKVMEALHDAYDHQPFITVSDDAPHVSACIGSNSAHLTARVDDRTGTVLVLAALDNLTKGTSGQAIQCLNLMYGLPETTGLALAGVGP